MIIKTLRWKVGGFGRLVDYVGKELVAYVAREEGAPFGILHNLRYTEDSNEIARQFAENDAFRKPRKDGVAMYHEILSFHGRDRGAITPEALEDITREYLRLRAPRALAFACPHYDRDHVHVHIAISGIEFGSSKTLRMDNRTFTSVRRKIEHYQLTRYPELEHSLVHLPKRVRSKELREEIEQERPIVERCYEEAQSLDDFFGRVADAGVDESKYLLDQTTGRYTFDVDLDRLTELDLRMRELEAFQRLRAVREALDFPHAQILDSLIERYEGHLFAAEPSEEAPRRPDMGQRTEEQERVEELESARTTDQARDQEGGLER